MINSNAVPLHKKTQSQWLIGCIFFLPFVCPFLMEFIGLSSLVRYIMDICWVMLLVLLTLNPGKRVHIRRFSYWIGAFLVYAVVSYLFQFQSPLYLLWGIRNNFRFYVFFVAVACFLRTQDRDRYMHYLDVLFWINATASALQFFIWDYKGDHVGGLFGVLNGANGYTNIFLVIYLAKTMIWLLSRQESSMSSYMKIVVCLVLAAFAELKFFFIEAVVIICAVVFLSGFTFRKLFFLLFSFIALFIGVNVLVIIFPESFFVFDISAILESATSSLGYTSSGDLNRLTAIQSISNNLMESIWQQFFGLGLGNCDSAGFDFLTTPFYEKYGHLHYSFFSSAFIFLELGWLGMFFFFGFFILVFLKVSNLRKQHNENLIYCNLSIVVSILCILIAIYNSSLRTEAGYMAYFVMALPFVKPKEPQNT